MKIKSVEITHLNYNSDVVKHEYYENANLDIDGPSNKAELSTAKWRVIADGQILYTSTAYSGANYDLMFIVLVEHTRSIKQPTTYRKQTWYVKF